MSTTRWYGLLLGLYPRSFREQFGAEMTELYRQLDREARNQGPFAHLILAARESAGLSTGLLKEWCDRAGRLRPADLLRARHLPGRLWGDLVRERDTATGSAVLGAGLAGIFLLGMALAQGDTLFLWVSYPVAALALGLLGGTLGWLRGGRQVGRGRRTAGLLLLALLLAPSLRVVDLAYLSRLADEGRGTSYAHAGVRAEVIPLAAEASFAAANRRVPRPHDGLLRTRMVHGPDGRGLLTIWQRAGDTPPYELLVVLGCGMLALLTHTGRRRLSRPQAEPSGNRAPS